MHWAASYVVFPAEDLSNQLKYSETYRQAMNLNPKSKKLSHARFVTPKAAEHFSGLPEHWTDPRKMVSQAAFQAFVPLQAGGRVIMCKRSTKFAFFDCAER